MDPVGRMPPRIRYDKEPRAVGEALRARCGSDVRPRLPAKRRALHPSGGGAVDRAALTRASRRPSRAAAGLPPHLLLRALHSACTPWLECNTPCVLAVLGRVWISDSRTLLLRRTFRVRPPGHRVLPGRRSGRKEEGMIRALAGIFRSTALVRTPAPASDFLSSAAVDRYSLAPIRYPVVSPFDLSHSFTALLLSARTRSISEPGGEFHNFQETSRSTTFRTRSRSVGVNSR
jgi:hypothetical protein